MADSAVIQDPGAFDSIPVMSINSALSIGATYLIPLQRHNECKWYTGSKDRSGFRDKECVHGSGALLQ